MPARLLTPIVGGAAAVTYPSGSQLWGMNTPIIGNTDTQTYEPGLEPTNNGDGSWTYRLPARADAASVGDRRRVERLWTVDGRTCTNIRGDILVFDGDYMGVLGAAPSSPNQWHVIWQMHGPGGNDLQNWGGPPLGLCTSNGHTYLSGGEDHPNNQYTATDYYGWWLDLGPWVDGVRHHVRIEVKIGNDPDGWVSCWHDGVNIVERWRPQGFWRGSGGGYTGKYPGTIFSTPGQAGDWVQNRGGLYRGAQNGEAPPTYEQWVRWWPWEVSPAHQS